MAGKKTSTVTWDELLKKCSRIHAEPEDSEQMMNVLISSYGNVSTPVEATVVPTRMHEPGFYVRSINGTPLWASWMLRNEEDLALFSRLVEAGHVTRL